MSKIQIMFHIPFPVKHFLLVVSLALNISFMLRGTFENVKDESFKHVCLVQERALLPSIPMPNYSDVSERQPDQKPSTSLLSSSSLKASPISDNVRDDGTRLINVDHGDPTMYEKYWRQMGDKTAIVIPGWQSVSYFSDKSNVCWFLEPDFAKEVVRVHNVVGNAITKGRHIVVGTGSSQLYLAALYALSPHESTEPINVVSAAPYYSSYPLMTDYQKSGLYKWAGDAHKFNRDGPYIELVTSPNNPDGFVRRPVVNRSEGILIHDLAYYWPQYTPIPSPADYDIMLFTVSKSTGHAGMRIGWALIKDQDVAKRMTKFIELNTIGVSKDSQLRAAKILRAVSDSSEQAGNTEAGESFFNFSHDAMADRWKRLRTAVKISGTFSLPNFPPEFCTYFGHKWETQPAFAWVKCKRDIEDCEDFLRGYKILTRGGKHFGVSPGYVRVSMLDKDENFNSLVDRISNIYFKSEFV